MRKVQYSIFLAALLAAGQAHALGLGKPRIDSYIGQPLRVTAPLILSDTERAELGEGKVGVGGAELFERFNLPYMKMHTMLKVSIDSRRHKEAVLITTTRPFVEPLIDIPLDIRIGGSRLVRVVTLLVDPPPQDAAVAPAVAEVTATNVDKGEGAARSRGSVTMPRRASAEREWSVIRDGHYGPVAPNQTLGDIASELQYRDVTFYQKLVALWQANPQAFRSDNMNSLMAGSTLRLPSRSEVVAISAAMAKREVLAQYHGKKSTLEVVSAAVAQEQPSEQQAPAAAQAEPVSPPQGEEQRLRIAAPLNGDDLPAEYRNAFNSLSAEMDALERENAQLRARVTSLEQQIAVISELLLARSGEDAAVMENVTTPQQADAPGELLGDTGNVDAAKGQKHIVEAETAPPVGHEEEIQRFRYGIYLALFLGSGAVVGLWLLYRRRRQWQRMEQLFR